MTDLLNDETDNRIDALEADRSRLQAELDAITVQRDWAMASRDEAIERLEKLRRRLHVFFCVATTESKASRPEVRGAVGEETE